MTIIRTDIKQWEIWNEPNIFFWDGPKDLYAELLTRSYAAIKETDPQAQVLGLSTAGIDQKFISRMLELQAPFDILTIHPYRTHLNDLAFIEDLQEGLRPGETARRQRRPVWLTEMGWSTQLTPQHAAAGFRPHHPARPGRTHRSQLFVRHRLRGRAPDLSGTISEMTATTQSISNIKWALSIMTSARSRPTLPTPR